MLIKAVRFNKKYSFCFLKSMYSFHRWITRTRRSCPSFTAYLYVHKTIQDCTFAEKTGFELASKVDRILYTRKTGWELPHQLWLIKNLSRLSQTRHYKMSVRAVHSKSDMTQETEITLKRLYRYFSYVQLNV